MSLPIQAQRRARKPKADGTPRKRPVDWEGNEQAVLIRWLLGEKMRGEPVGKLYDAIYHVPNGGQRNKKTASVNTKVIALCWRVGLRKLRRR